MRRRFLFSIPIIFFSVLLLSDSSVLADVAIPQAQNIQIKLTQNFPDYNFSLCVLPYSSKYDKGYHYTYYYDELKLTPIEISVEKPFNLAKENYSKFMYLAAAKKGIENTELKNRIINALKTESSNDVPLFKIDSSDTGNSEYNVRGESPRNLIYTIEAIDNSGIKTSRQFSESSHSGKTVYLVVGLALTAVFIALGIIFIKKLRKS